jgi:RNA polymerase sigma-70 factor, ECF subfamily
MTITRRPPPVELAILRKAQRGDERAFAILVRGHREWLERRASQLLGDPVEVQDVVQEVFLKIFLRLPRFALRARFATWAYQITTNTCIDRITASARANEVSFDIAGGYPAPDSSPDLAADISRALKTLPSPQKEIVAMKHLAGFTFQEVAERLDLPIGTVKSHDSRGRTALAPLLRAYEHSRAA